MRRLLSIRESRLPVSAKLAGLALVCAGMLDAELPSPSERLVLDAQNALLRAWEQTSEVRARLWSQAGPYVGYVWSDLGPVLVPLARAFSVPGRYLFDKLQWPVSEWRDIAAITLISFWFWRPLLRKLASALSDLADSAAKSLGLLVESVSDRLDPLVTGMIYMFDHNTDPFWVSAFMTAIGVIPIWVGVVNRPALWSYVPISIGVAILAGSARTLCQMAIANAAGRNEGGIVEHPYHPPLAAVVLAGAPLVWPAIVGAFRSQTAPASPTNIAAWPSEPLLVLIPLALLAIPFVVLYLALCFALVPCFVAVAFTSPAVTLYFITYGAARVYYHFREQS